MKIIFAGTPAFAADHLAALLNAGHNVIAVYTQPDRPAGRGKKLTPSDVKTLALEHNIPVYQPASLKSDEAQQEMAALNADLMVVVAYGLILPKSVLAIPTQGCINVHGSILPKWRGAAPIQRAIWAGDAQTGVTIMQMDEGLDTGDMLHIARLPIESADTSATLYNKLARLGPEALITCVSKLADIVPEPQNNEKATYAKKLSKEEARLDWQLSAEQLERNIRAFNPWPVAWTVANGHNIKIWRAITESHTPSQPPGTIVKADKNGLAVATASGTLVITELQVPGKKAMPFSDVFNARKDWFAVGNTLGDSPE